jgi:hypothetical protein
MLEQEPKEVWLIKEVSQEMSNNSVLKATKHLPYLFRLKKKNVVMSLDSP